MDEKTIKEKLIIKKPWGFEYSIFKDGMMVRMLHIRAGEETSYHCHMKKNVLMILLKGRARLLRSDDYLADIELKPFFVRQIPKATFHKTTAFPGEDVVLLEIEDGDDTNDLIRAEDKYKRNQGYEVKDIVSIEEVLNEILH